MKTLKLEEKLKNKVDKYLSLKEKFLVFNLSKEENETLLILLMILE